MNGKEGGKMKQQELRFGDILSMYIKGNKKLSISRVSKYTDIPMNTLFSFVNNEKLPNRIELTKIEKAIEKTDADFFRNLPAQYRDELSCAIGTPVKPADKPEPADKPDKSEQPKQEPVKPKPEPKKEHKEERKALTPIEVGRNWLVTNKVTAEEKRVVLSVEKDFINGKLDKDSICRQFGLSSRQTSLLRTACGIRPRSSALTRVAAMRKKEDPDYYRHLRDRPPVAPAPNTAVPNQVSLSIDRDKLSRMFSSLSAEDQQAVCNHVVDLFLKSV